MSDRAGTHHSEKTGAAAMDWRVVLLILLAISGTYVWWHIGRGWIPFDDGTVAQSADRVLRGELPHRDFDDLYTGGMTLLNAAAFRLLGTNLWTLRLVLFAFFIAWVPALFYIATRFSRPVLAAFVVCVAVVWSLPNYPAAMASWYNLFFATFGLAAALRYLEARRRRWLFVAGVAGGLSFLVKVIGLYYVAGVLLFLVYHAHYQSGVGAGSSRAYATFVSVSLLLFVVVLFSVIRHQLHPAELANYFIPCVAIAGLLARNEWVHPAGPADVRFKALFRVLVPFLAGVALPVGLFLVPYARDGAIGALVNGVFVVPTRRFNFVYVAAQPLITWLALLPFVALAVLVHRRQGRVSRREMVLLVLLLLFVIVVSGGNGALYRTVWFAARSLFPVLVLAGVVMLMRARGAQSALHERTALVLFVTAVCFVVQFPYSLSLYFCYIAPLVVLSALALYSNVRPPLQAIPAVVLGFSALFAVVRMNTTRIASLGAWYQPQQPVALLALDRGGIEVPRSDSLLYGTLVAKLRARARGGYTWASPDSPEIYFLSGLRNPTRTLFEVFDDATNSSAKVLASLDSHGITAVVLSAPSFSPPISANMYAQLEARYPHAEYVGPFQLRWRD